jgi:hypothetical protein
MVQDSVTVALPPVALTVDWLNASALSESALVSAAAEIAGNPSAVNSPIAETETMTPGRNLILLLLCGWLQNPRHAPRGPRLIHPHEGLWHLRHTGVTSLPIVVQYQAIGLTWDYSCKQAVMLIAEYGVIIAVPGGKLRVALAALLLSPGRAVSPEDLAETLWGSEGVRITTQPPGYRIQVNASEVDVSLLRAG